MQCLGIPVYWVLLHFSAQEHIGVGWGEVQKQFAFSVGRGACRMWGRPTLLKVAPLLGFSGESSSTLPSMSGRTPSLGWCLEHVYLNILLVCKMCSVFISHEQTWASDAFICANGGHLTVHPGSRLEFPPLTSYCLVSVVFPRLVPEGVLSHFALWCHFLYPGSERLTLDYLRVGRFLRLLHSPGWMIVKQHSHLVLFLALSWAELSWVWLRIRLSELCQALAASGASLLTLHSTHSCSICSRWSCLHLECLLQPSLLHEVLHFSIFSPSFHVCTESVATSSPLWHPLSP